MSIILSSIEFPELPQYVQLLINRLVCVFFSLFFAVRSGFGTTARPKSLALPGSTKGTVRALYAYLSSGEHQINFLEGDLILLLGDEPVSFHSNANGTIHCCNS